MVKTYNVDNLWFDNNNFSEDLLKGGQTITFYGVGAHRQNTVVESNFKEVCYGGRTILLHAKWKWPKVVSIVFWSYIVHAIVERHNILSFNKDDESPLENILMLKMKLSQLTFTFGDAQSTY